ncbi:MAG: hypothetical protein U0X20_20910 [Caldilineaceae bacterium]
MRGYRAGGALIFSGTAGLDKETGDFKLAGAPVRYLEPAPTQPSFLRPTGIKALETELAADYDYVYYEQAHCVEPVDNAQSYGEVRRAYFTRTWQHFMGHQHSAMDRSLATPLAVRKDKVLYLAAPLFRGYKKFDYWAYRAMVQGMLSELLPDQLLYPLGPGWVEYTLQRQPDNQEHGARHIVHLVSYQSRRSLQPIAHVDQAWSVAGLGFKVRVESAPKSVYLAPEGKLLPWNVQDGYVHVVLPSMRTSAVVVIE